MYRVTPCIREHVNELRQRLQHEHDGHKQPRLQTLYLLASGQAYRRQEVAQLLGLDHQTIGRWLAIYAAGGLPALLATYMSRPACLSRWHPRSSPVLRRCSGVQRASLRMRRCANGCGGPTAWRSHIRLCRRWCVRASEPSSRCRARATPKNSEAIPAF
jgi:hypothetical protein